jgi:two-component system, chemotaxis family, chemotaxis protein CheY
MKILVVDDESVSLRKMEFIMKSYGTCDRVDSGQAAIDAFVKGWENWSPYDLITLDMMMEGMNGNEALAKIRDLEKQKDVPEDKRVRVIMVTAMADKDTIISCVQSGCDDFISKPFERQIVEGKLSRLFPHKQFKVSAF